MEEQQRIQPLVFEKNGNGKHPQPLLPVYTTTFQENKKADEWDLRQLLAVVRRRSVVIGSVAIALSASVWFWTLTRQAKYQGQFGLLVEPVTTEQSKLAGLSEFSATNANLQQEGLDYNTQILVLQSPELMAPIIKQLSSRYPDISYDSLIKNLKISRFKQTKILEVSYQDSDTQKIQLVLQQLAKAYLKYSTQERQTNLRQGIQFVDSQMPQLQSRVNSLQRELQRFRQQYNFIDPEFKAQKLSEQVSMIEFQRLDTQKQLAEARTLYGILQGRSGIRLAESGALDGTSVGRSVPQLPESGALDGTSVGRSVPQLPESGASDETSVSRSNVPVAQPRALERTSPSRSGTAAVQNEGSVYQSLMGLLRDVDTQIAAELTRFREDSPTIRALRQKRANLLPVLRQETTRVLKNKIVEVANQISALEVRAAKIAQAGSSLNQEIKQLPILARQYTDMQRQLKVASESLNRFLEKRESLQVESAQKENSWQLIAPPLVFGVPVSPNLARNFILGAIAGLLTGMAAGLLAERLDNVFHSPEDLKEVTKLPLLGVIPFQKHLKQLASYASATVDKTPDGFKLVSRNISNDRGYSYFPFLEAFRSLHTNIGFLGSDTPIHSLVISSAVPGDGKSTVSLNLAQAAAAMGQRVLLVDADLRRPQFHTLLGLPNEQGLSNVISTNLPVLEVIQRSPITDNLFVLTSGQIPPDPTKLLSSKKMHNVMEQLRQNFDLVIYDTPPLLGLADSSLIANYTAGIVLVVRMAKTDRSVLRQALEGLKLSRATVLGTVCNEVKNYSNTAYGYYNYQPRTHGA